MWVLGLCAVAFFHPAGIGVDRALALPGNCTPYLKATPGRLGNKLQLLQGALAFSVGMGCKQLAFGGPLRKDLRQIFELPESIELGDTSQWRWAGDAEGCVRKLKKGGYNLWHGGCTKLSLADEATLLQRYLLPHLAPEFQTAYEAAIRNDSAARLVIHLRHGDIMTDGSARAPGWSHRQPPCDAYSQIIEAGGYTGVRILYEPLKGRHLATRSSPCISKLQEKYGSIVDARPGSLASDVAVVLGSQNVVASACARAPRSHQPPASRRLTPRRQPPS